MIPVRKILDYYFVDVQEDREGNVNIYCRCPFHKGTGKSPQNFSINRENGRWICFNPTCDAKSGSILRFIYLQEDCTIAEAKELLKDRFSSKNVPWKVMLQAMERDEDTSSSKKLGVAEWPSSMEPIPKNHPWIKRREYTVSDFRQFRVSFDKYRPAYIFFPVFYRKRLRGFTSRDIRPNPVRKWEHDYGLPRKRIFYNYDVARTRDYVFICEGPLDVIRLGTFGYNGAVAAFGATATPHQTAKILETWDSVIVAFDNDDAGNSGADKLCEKLKSNVKFCAKLTLPEKTDLDDLRSRKTLLSYIQDSLTVYSSTRREKTWADLRRQWS